MTSTRPVVTVGFIHPLMVHASFMGSILQIAHHERCEVLDVMSGPNISKARNFLVENFLKSDADYLLMLDTDMIFRYDCVKRLVEHELPVVNGMYMQPQMDGGEPFPCMYRHTDGDRDSGVFTAVNSGFSVGELVDVDAAGTGFMMVRRDVFEAIRDKFPNPAAQWFQETQIDENLVGEDLTFCMRVERCGFVMKVDTSVQAGHIKPAMVGNVK